MSERRARKQKKKVRGDENGVTRREEERRRENARVGRTTQFGCRATSFQVYIRTTRQFSKTRTCVHAFPRSGNSCLLHIFSLSQAACRTAPVPNINVEMSKRAQPPSVFLVSLQTDAFVNSPVRCHSFIRSFIYSSLPAFHGSGSDRVKLLQKMNY